MNGMPIIHKTIVILKYVMDLSLAEISDILQMNTQNAKTYLRDGREYLSLSVELPIDPK
ncbi:sigma factor-like helix-turn-helix DNA-binding protein [Paenibacillus sp. FSL K6-3166]|uniref:sigma factor-like helix-turn-helix DNA-binding protein n=1 Tax=Paenibacillus sp. FSL K6-3166 TaxID=2921492 RepID=UPI0030FB3982